MSNQNTFDETGHPRKITLIKCVDCGALIRKTSGNVKRCKPCAGQALEDRK